MRNVELTKQRILEAATAEFSEHGFAGARVDRIAANANANKSLIYSYFGNKETLFLAVRHEILRQIVQDVPMDPNDLPGYLARRLEWQFQNPALSRIFTWGMLELNDAPAIAGASEIHARKLALIAGAQEDGVISTTFTPQDVLDLIDALTRPTRWLGNADAVDTEEFMRYKQIAVAALKSLLAPD
jgi:AcrR family transcriptional regulator